MLLNHIKIAFRTLIRKKFYSLLNIAGLALGIVAAVFIWQYVAFERSYDNFHEDRDRIYRLHAKFFTPAGQDDADAMNAAPVGPALKAEYPEVEEYVRITPEYGRTVFRYGEKQFEEQKIYYTDSNFFDLFDYKILYGDPTNALVEPFSIILTRSMAQRYLGHETDWVESPIGKTINVNNQVDMKITGIVEDVPENSHFKFNALVSFVTFPSTNGDPTNQWEWNDFYTYVQLQEGADMEEFQQNLDDFADRHLNSQGSEEYKVYYGIQPLQSIHLNSNLPYEMESNGDGKTVSFLLLMAILILIIAWANYINLSTARAEERAQEVGVRKVIGANRMSLINQFLIESALVNFIALALALFLIVLCQPLMDNLVGKQVETIFDSPGVLFLTTLLVLILGTLISGMYPAFVLSGFKPAKTLKSSAKGGITDWFRLGLVTFQYVTSIVLIISTMIIFRQLDYMKNMDLGFSIEEKIIVNAPSVYNDSVQSQLFDAFRNTLLQDPRVISVSASSAVPGKYYLDLDSRGGIRMAGADENTAASFTSYRIDEDFFGTYGISIIAGKDFSRETSADDGALAINRAALKLLGFTNPDDAIGKRVRFQSDERLLPIANVFENYHHKSLRHAYEPTILWNHLPDPLYYTIKYNISSTDQVKSIIENTEKTWTSIFTDNPFQYFFFDEQYNAQYEADKRLGKIIGTFALFAVFIACLGLFGLTSYMISIRTKEIGIRKVLGASINAIVMVLTKDFLSIVLGSIVIAIPLSLYFGRQWLENFAYKSNLSWWIFVLAAIIALSIAVITISIQSIRAAMTNPVDSLRSE
ncbi:MAG: FtsX-like permease family protein [Saprospiraceae bacterium]|nr:FtsX-like permease family protein [Saprospiraceae bacterium]